MELQLGKMGSLCPTQLQRWENVTCDTSSSAMYVCKLCVEKCWTFSPDMYMDSHLEKIAIM